MSLEVARPPFAGLRAPMGSLLRASEGPGCRGAWGLRCYKCPLVEVNVAWSDATSAGAEVRPLEGAGRSAAAAGTLPPRQGEILRSSHGVS